MKKTLTLNTPPSANKSNYLRLSGYIFFLFSLLFLSSCSDEFNGISPEEYVEKNDLDATELDGGLFIKIDEKGDSQRATENDVVLIDYRGILANTGETILDEEDITALYGNLLLGLQAGLKEIGVGGTCTLVLPPDLAFGDALITDVPQKSTMVFEVTLKDIISTTTIEGYIERNNLTPTVLEKGVQIVIIEPGNDVKPTSTSDIKVNYKGRLINELLFDQGEEASFNLGNLIEGWQIGLPQIGEGGKCILIIPSEVAYGTTGAGNGIIPPNAPLVFEIDLLEVGSEADTYVEENNLTTEILEGGVHIIVHELGDVNNKPDLNSTITASYEGRLTDGYVFDSSDEATFQLSSLIKGWQTGLQEIGEGGSCTLIIPPSAGYGSQGTGSIPGNSVLIFDIEIKSVF